eukprot:s1007_g22.t1
MRLLILHVLPRNVAANRWRSLHVARSFRPKKVPFDSRFLQLLLSNGQNLYKVMPQMFTQQAELIYAYAYLDMGQTFVQLNHGILLRPPCPNDPQICAPLGFNI